MPKDTLGRLLWVEEEIYSLWLNSTLHPQNGESLGQRLDRKRRLKIQLDEIQKMKEDHEQIKIKLTEQKNEFRYMVPEKEYTDKMAEMKMYAVFESKKKRIEREENKEEKGMIYQLENQYFLENEKIFAQYIQETDELRDLSEKLENHMFKMSISKKHLMDFVQIQLQETLG
jgi:hypothetical protein